jgi:hypothetical protein
MPANTEILANTQQWRYSPKLSDANDVSTALLRPIILPAICMSGENKGCKTLLTEGNKRLPKGKVRIKRKQKAATTQKLKMLKRRCIWCFEGNAITVVTNLYTPLIKWFNAFELLLGNGVQPSKKQV